MKKGRIGNITSTAFLVAGGVFALQVLISNVSAVTNRIDGSNSMEIDYIGGIMDRHNQKDETDALFVGDLCVFSESGYFDNMVGKVGYNDKDAEKVRINCDGVVPGISFDKATRTMIFDGYTGGENITYFNTKKTAKDDLNIKVYGENKVGRLWILEYSNEDEIVDVNISGGGTLNANLGINIEGSLFKRGNGLEGYQEKFNTNVENVVINIPEIAKTKTSDGREYNAYPLFSAHNLELENVKFSGIFGDLGNSKMIVKDSDIEIYGDATGGDFFYDVEVSFENSNVKIDNGVGVRGNSSGMLKIKNSNVEAKNTKDEPVASSVYTSLPSLYIGGSSPFPILVYKDLKRSNAEDTSDRISLENVKVEDGLKIVSKEVVYNDHLHGEEAYIAFVFGTDQTGYNEETERWENYPRTVTIKAEKPELVGAKIIDEKKNEAGKTTEPEGKDILEGENQEMNVSDIKDLVIRYNRDISLFEKVLFDGKELAKKDYTLASGSTILTIKADYLKTQGAGEHKILAYFEGDKDPIETTVKLKTSKDVRETKDEKTSGEEKKNVKTSNTGLYTVEKGDHSEISKTIFTVLACGLIISGAILKIRNRNRNKKVVYRLR